MPVYKYKAVDQNGRSVQGVLEAESDRALIEVLRQKRLTVLSVQTAGKSKQQNAKGRVSADDLVVFSRQLATMVNAGLPLIQALSVLGEQNEKPAFRAIIKEIENEVEGGANLSDALAKHPKVFSSLFVNLVRAGEVSGMLDEILARVASYLEETEALRRKVKSALVYPVIITLIALSITAFLVMFVIPKFRGIFEGLGGDLPAPTQILLNISAVMRRYFLIVAAVVTAMIFGFKAYGKTPGGRMKLDGFKLQMPVFGLLLRKVAIAKFTRTLCTLIRSGVPILGALEIVSKTAGNMVVETAVEKVRSSVREGESIAGPLAESGVFPPMVVRMISVGEQTGSMESMLGKIADFYDDQVDNAVAALTSMIEPLIIAFLGVVIGGIVVAMFLPVFKLTEVMGGGG